MKSILSEQREADEELCGDLGWLRYGHCDPEDIDDICRRAIVRIRALSEALQEACHKRDGLLVPEWQPIETAPEDGTEVLLWATMPRIEAYIALTGYFDEMDGAWSVPVASIYGPFVYPSHWMPLPTPPGEK